MCVYIYFFFLNHSAHHRWAGEDRHSGLEDQHPPEALHKRKQRGAVVLAGRGGLQRREEGASPAVRHRIHQGPFTGVQGTAGWVMDWLKAHAHDP